MYMYRRYQLGIVIFHIIPTCKPQARATWCRPFWASSAAAAAFCCAKGRVESFCGQEGAGAR